MKAIIAALVLLCASAAFAQTGATQGAWDLNVFAGGGTWVPGGTEDTHLFNAGVGLGKVITADHGSGFFKGNFEYGVDFMPVYYIVQPVNNAYGVSFSPVKLRWNFTAPKKVIPYLELGGGVLFSNEDVPNFTNDVNFTTQARLGMNLFTRKQRSVSMDMAYVHISNAGLATPNPGLNTLQFSVGYHWWKK